MLSWMLPAWCGPRVLSQPRFTLSSALILLLEFSWLLRTPTGQPPNLKEWEGAKVLMMKVVLASFCRCKASMQLKGPLVGGKGESSWGLGCRQDSKQPLEKKKASISSGDLLWTPKPNGASWVGTTSVYQQKYIVYFCESVSQLSKRTT